MGARASWFTTLREAILPEKESKLLAATTTITNLRFKLPAR